eukprot:TRINITY_DN56694_c0_g1_i1.p1 TRINITY_DN56694_c0_g1~~TRINITY_DN56694_c0_g1_i1.p1  ORF type:complete len:866 (+),score=483.41 TRINITY_DN56694_c0_g1_i1:37-2598(+)
MVNVASVAVAVVALLLTGCATTVTHAAQPRFQETIQVTHEASSGGAAEGEMTVSSVASADPSGVPSVTPSHLPPKTLGESTSLTKEMQSQNGDLPSHETETKPVNPGPRKDAGVSDSLCLAWGDTHIEPFGGQPYYDMYDESPYLLTRWDDGGNTEAKRFSVQSMPFVVGAGRSIQRDFAVRCGMDVVRFVSNPTTFAVQVQMNGVDITHMVPAVPWALFPAAPRGEKLRPETAKYQGQYSVWRDKTSSNSSTVFHVNCGFDATNKDNTYASGMMATFSWRVASYLGEQYMVGSAVIAVSHERKGELVGACGWTADGRPPHMYNNVIMRNTSLFVPDPPVVPQTKPDGQQGPTADTTALVAELSTCARMITSALQMPKSDTLKPLHDRFEEVDPSFIRELEVLHRFCALDVHFGFQPSQLDVDHDACAIVGLARALVQSDIQRQAPLVRQCKLNVSEIAPLYYELFQLNRLCAPEPEDGSGGEPFALPDLGTCPTPSKQPEKQPHPLIQVRLLADHLRASLANEKAKTTAEYEHHMKRSNVQLEITRVNLLKKQTRSAELEREVRGLTRERDEYEANEKDLSGKVDQLTQEDEMTMKMLRNGHETRVAEQRTFLRKLDETKRVLAVMSSITAGLNKSMGWAEKTTKTLNETMHAAESEAKNHPSDVHRFMSTAIGQLQTMLAKRPDVAERGSALRNIITLLHKQLRDYKTSLERTEQGAAEMWRSRKADLTKVHNAHVEKLKSLKRRLEEARDALIETTDKLGQLKAEFKMLQPEIDVLIKQRDTLSEEISSYEGWYQKAMARFNHELETLDEVIVAWRKKAKIAAHIHEKTKTVGVPEKPAVPFGSKKSSSS